jgi:GT2 family glycosyltransferase
MGMSRRTRGSAAQHIGGGLAALAATALAWWRLERSARAVPRLPAGPVAPASLTGPLPQIAIVIPARDEAAHIARCVWSLALQALAPCAIWVVDDHSTDDTSIIVQRLAHDLHALYLLPSAERPAGWAGKNWALHQGMRAALADVEVEWLLLTDADTWHAPSLLAHAWRFAAATGADVLSILPGIEERAPGAMLMRAGVGEFYSFFYGANYAARMATPQNPAVMAAGQFILARAEVCRALNYLDRDELRAALDDDRAFMLAAKQAGFHLAVAQAPQLLTAQGYPSLRAAWQGHAHHLAGAVRAPGAFPHVIGALLALQTVTLPPIVGLVRAVVRSARHGWGAQALPLARWSAQLLAMGALRLRAAHLTDLPPWYAAAAPLSALLASALALRLLGQRLRERGDILWKGRRYV